MGYIMCRVLRHTNRPSREAHTLGLEEAGWTCDLAGALGTNLQLDWQAPTMLYIGLSADASSLSPCEIPQVRADCDVPQGTQDARFFSGAFFSPLCLTTRQNLNVAFTEVQL